MHRGLSMAVTIERVQFEPSVSQIGPLKLQLLSFTAESGDTSAEITCSALITLVHFEISGVTQTSAPQLSGNVATIAFLNPGRTVYGNIRAYGR